MKLIVIWSGIALLALTAAQPVGALPGADESGEPDCTVSEEQPDDEGKDLYMRACATCHGVDGRGASAHLLGFETPMPDFSDCNFATREPDADWIAVAHQGGPVRGFAQEMPAFGEALSEEELQKILGFIRTFCTEDEWPRGELNLPRAFVTEKAYPEDETVISTTVETDGGISAITEFVYEKRFGARSQIELVLPVGLTNDASEVQLGDIALSLKRVIHQSLPTGSIFSLGGELILPTGRADEGLGAGTVVFEPFASLGQGLFTDYFLQVQGGLEFPLDQEGHQNEVFLNGVLGRTFTEGRWGRAWSPMVEMIGTQGIDSGPMQVDIAPQLQVTLNQRQHIMLNVGLRVPLGASSHPTQLMIYLLWEWFDGGFFEGW